MSSDTQAHIGALENWLAQDPPQPVSELIATWSAQQLAQVLEAAPPKPRNALWQHLDEEQKSAALHKLSDEVRNQFLQAMEVEELVPIVQSMEADDTADILQQLSGRQSDDVLQAISEQDRRRLDRVLTYSQDSAGGLMNTDTITVRPDNSLEVVLRYLRLRQKIPAMTDSIIVVDRQDQCVGLLPLRKLLVSDPTAKVEEVMQADPHSITAATPATEVAHLFQHNDWISSPVVDEQGHLLGRITVDDVIGLISGLSDRPLRSLAGLAENEDTFASVGRILPRRGLWLAINLLTTLAAAATIDLFQDTIAQVVALAVLMPIVASMGGVAGLQTLTIVIRGLAMGEIGVGNVRWLLGRELALALLNGLGLALLVGAAVGLWFGDPLITLALGLALLINLVAAALAGMLLPVGLQRLRVDPALAGGVILTTITDIVGFLSFLGLATVFFR